VSLLLTPFAGAALLQGARHSWRASSLTIQRRSP
jgi:hypothetical protein